MMTPTHNPPPPHNQENRLVVEMHSKMWRFLDLLHTSYTFQKDSRHARSFVGSNSSSRNQHLGSEESANGFLGEI